MSVYAHKAAVILKHLSYPIMCCLVNVKIKIFLHNTKQDTRYKIVYFRHEAHS